MQCSAAMLLLLLLSLNQLQFLFQSVGGLSLSPCILPLPFFALFPLLSPMVGKSPGRTVTHTAPPLPLPVPLPVPPPAPPSLSAPNIYHVELRRFLCGPSVRLSVRPSDPLFRLLPSEWRFDVFLSAKTLKGPFCSFVLARKLVPLPLPKLPSCSPLP